MSWVRVFTSQEIMSILAHYLSLRSCMRLACFTSATIRRTCFPLDTKEWTFFCGTADEVAEKRERERKWSEAVFWWGHRIAEKFMLLDEDVERIYGLHGVNDTWPIPFFRVVLGKCKRFPPRDQEEEEQVSMCVGGHCGTDKWCSSREFVKPSYSKVNMCLHCFWNRNTVVDPDFNMQRREFVMGVFSSSVAEAVRWCILKKKVEAFCDTWKTVLDEAEFERFGKFVGRCLDTFAKTAMSEDERDVLLEKCSVITAGPRNYPLVDHVMFKRINWYERHRFMENDLNDDRDVFYNRVYIEECAQVQFDTIVRKTKMAFSDSIFKSADIPIPEPARKRLKRKNV